MVRIFDDEDRPMIADFAVETGTSDADADLVLASGGGRAAGGAIARNHDYASGLLLLLRRLAAHDAVLRDALVDSAPARLLPEPDRRLLLRRHALPLRLASVDDLENLRLDLTGSQRTVARAPDARTGGNNRKRLRLRIGSGGAPTDPVTLSLLLAHPSGGRRQDPDSDNRPQHAGRRQATGQGLLDPTARRAVELHAMALADEHYRAAGWTVTDVSAVTCYDLHCTRGDEELRVEVKGSTVGAGHVRLTGNEVSHALAHPHDVALFVVHSVTLRPGDDGPRASGGTVLRFEPWRLDPDRLSAVTYIYALDGATATGPR